MGMILWLLFAIFSAMIASSKGRSSLSWFFIGLLFGPFGLLVGLMEKVENENSKQKIINKLQSNTNELEDTESYYYEVVSLDKENDWIKLRRILIDLYPDYEIKQDDADVLVIYYNKATYIKMKKILKGTSLYFGVESIGSGAIKFNNDVNIILSEKTDGLSKEVEINSTLDSTDKLIKLAELKEKGLLSDEEFNSQKKKLLAE